MSSKQELRADLLLKRKAIRAENRDRMNRALCDAVLAWAASARPRVLASYMPMRGEPDLLPIAGNLIDMGIRLALPVVDRKNAPLEFAAWTPGMALTRDLAGVSVPAPPRDCVDPDALLIPCVGFNRTCYRLGYGAGYYDRTQADRAGIVTIGIAWSESLVEFAPDSFDMPLDAIITEAGTWRAGAAAFS